MCPLRVILREETIEFIREFQKSIQLQSGESSEFEEGIIEKFFINQMEIGSISILLDLSLNLPMKIQFKEIT